MSKWFSEYTMAEFSNCTMPILETTEMIKLTLSICKVDQKNRKIFIYLDVFNLIF